MLHYKHLDVFSKIPFAGNSLSVFILSEAIATEMMQKTTQEMRHFESIFLLPHQTNKYEYVARIFTLEEELDFAGHPLLGAASAIHDEYFKDLANIKVKFKLNTRSIEIETTRKDTYYSATMNQGNAEFGLTLPPAEINLFLDKFNLSHDNLFADLPLEVVSTGLPYLIVPLTSGLENIRHKNITYLLAQINAKFVYFYDVNKQEGRTWDNECLIEDIATGSAAGPVGAYLIKYGLAQANETIIIQQGSFVNRPSEIQVIEKDTNIYVSGDVCMVGSGKIL